MSDERKNRMALGKLMASLFILAAALAFAAAVIGFIKHGKFDFPVIMAGLFMLFFALFAFNYGKRLKDGAGK